MVLERWKSLLKTGFTILAIAFLNKKVIKKAGGRDLFWRKSPCTRVQFPGLVRKNRDQIYFWCWILKINNLMF